MLRHIQQQQQQQYNEQANTITATSFGMNNISNNGKLITHKVNYLKFQLYTSFFL